MQLPATNNFRLLFLDFETYYDDDYSLRKMSTPEYLLDDRFETIMCSVAEGKERAHVVDGPDFASYIAGFDPKTTATVTFNSLFDNCILAWRYGFVPHMMFDAMGMARALRGHLLQGASLAVVARTMKVGEKGHTVHDVKGLNRAAIQAAGLWNAYCDYCKLDTDLMSAGVHPGVPGIFWQLINEFPKSEWRVMDLVLRACVEPKFVLDRKRLENHLVATRAAKDTLLQTAGVTKAECMSTAKFTKLLQDRGVTIGLKPSPADPTRMIPAFAKSDDFMDELQNDPDPVIVAMASARLGLKSTLEETRCEKLLKIANLPWHKCKLPLVQLLAGSGFGMMPIPLRYGGPHTHRLSGEWGLNMQNMPRGSELRYSLLAPPGCAVISGDLAQIEARITAWITQALQLMLQFANDIDPYAALATAVFGFPVTKATPPLMADGTSIHRFIGKQGVLGLGYGAGKEKFFLMVTRFARAMKIDLTAINFTQQLADTTVDTYRNVNHAIVQNGWRKLDHLLDSAWVMGQPATFGPVIISHGTVEAPNGLKMKYLPGRTADGEKGYRHGKKYAKIYGAKFLENIVQFLARIIIMNAALRLEGRGYKFALQAHDELVFIVPLAKVEIAKREIYEELTRRPSWAKDLPLEASVKSGKTYGDAK